MDKNKYISPIRFFEHANTPINSSVNASRLKKIINAEFGMSDTGFIELENFTYNKSDLLQTVEQPNFETDISFHNLVWNEKELLNLIEKDEVDLNTIFNKLSQFEYKPGFKDFFSPYLAPVVDRMSRSLLYPPKLGTLSDLMQLGKYTNADDKLIAYKSIKDFFDDQYKILRNTTAENLSANMAEMDFWTKGNWYKILNQLPEFYYEFVDDVAVRLINLTVELQYKNSSVCRALSAKMVYLTAISEENKRIIKGNHSVFNERPSTRPSTQTQRETDSSSSGFSWWWIIWVVIAVIRIANTNACKNRSSEFDSPARYRNFNNYPTYPSSSSSSDRNADAAPPRNPQYKEEKPVVIKSSKKPKKPTESSKE